MLVNHEVDIAVIEKQNLDLASVIGINNTRTRVDEVLGCKSGAGSDASIYSTRVSNKSSWGCCGGRKRDGEG